MESSQQDSNLIKDLEKCVFEYNAEAAELLAKQIVELGADPFAAVDCLTRAIRVIGDRFGTGELFLPDLVGAGRVVDTAMAVLEEEIRRTGKEKKDKGIVVIGTVRGDLHSIGKNMVVAFCRATGFRVIDLGENVSAEKFMEAVKDHRPDILGMSSLLTTTMTEQQRVIESLGEKGIRKDIRIMVGGGPVTQEFSRRIGADGYAATAPAAAKLALKLMGQEGG